MGKLRNGCLSGSVALIVLVVAAVGVVGHLRKIDQDRMEKRIAEYDNCDHEALLSECRAMIEHREEYRKSRYLDEEATNGSRMVMNDDCIILGRKSNDGSRGSSWGADFPDTIRRLNPSQISIGRDRVEIRTIYRGHIRMARIGVIAFAVNIDCPVSLSRRVKEYIDGLYGFCY